MQDNKIKFIIDGIRIGDFTNSSIDKVKNEKYENEFIVRIKKLLNHANRYYKPPCLTLYLNNIVIFKQHGIIQWNYQNHYTPEVYNA